LFQAARILERNNRLVDAAATWERLIDTYPTAENSYRGLFLAGVSYYRATDYAKALTVFQRALVLAGGPGEQAAAYLWTGKVYQAQGDANAAKSAWEQGAQRDPTGYYSERANEFLQNRSPFLIDQPIDLGYDLEKERGKAEEWLRATFALPPETNLDGLGNLAADPRIIRGRAFWELGLYDEARNEFEIVRQAVATDPVQTYLLMNDMLKHGLYRSAILASRQILDLANLDDVGTLKAPEYFNHIRFGVYFKDLILESSQAENLHPLLILSVLRQESLFEGFARSGAGARGLMQIMPATGKEIASNISWPEDYVDEDLYRPEISIIFGSQYLARQRDYFDNSIFAALAAYNGGPGNTIIWNQLAGGDPDLLLEVIRADETRKYITQIYEFFNIYRLIYQRGY
ncbi:MAG: transglycosylase SLT domain-containing protein, partial [Anaerolineaceae bacterium]|nr:transglycosylase SLT domain-containing protein [Anaerolineaceae bacterium]